MIELRTDGIYYANFQDEINRWSTLNFTKEGKVNHSSFTVSKGSKKNFSGMPEMPYLITPDGALLFGHMTLRSNGRIGVFYGGVIYNNLIKVTRSVYWETCFKNTTYSDYKFLEAGNPEPWLINLNMVEDEPELLLPTLPQDFGAKGVVISVEWDDETHTIHLKSEQWKAIRESGYFTRNGPRYHSEGSSLKTTWTFNNGDLTVEYGNDGGIAYEGDIQDVEIKEKGKRGLSNH